MICKILTQYHSCQQGMRRISLRGAQKCAFCTFILGGSGNASRENFATLRLNILLIVLFITTLWIIFVRNLLAVVTATAKKL